MSPSQGGKGTTGKGAGGKASGPAAVRRLGLIVFGAAFVVLFVVVAIAEGIGTPSVPSGDVALVTSVPAEVGEVSKQRFDHALVLAAKQSGGEKSPQAGRSQIRRTEGNGAQRPVRSDLAAGPGRRIGDRSQRRRNRQGTEETEEGKLQIRKGIQGIPQGIRLHQGRRRRTGEAADPQHAAAGTAERRRVAAEQEPGEGLLRSGQVDPVHDETDAHDPRRRQQGQEEDRSGPEGARKGRLGDELEKGRQAVLRRRGDEGKRRPQRKRAGRRRRRTAGRGHLQSHRRQGHRPGQDQSRLHDLRGREQQTRESAGPEEGRKPDPGDAGAARRTGILRVLRRRLQHQVDAADALRLGLRDRTLRQLQGQRPPLNRARSVLRSQPERRPARSLPGAGLPADPGAARHGHAAGTEGQTAGPAAASRRAKKKKKSASLEGLPEGLVPQTGR